MSEPSTREQVRAARMEQWRQEAEQDTIENWVDGRFASLQTGTGTKATSLRSLMENPPDELLLEVARRGDTPAAREGAQRILTSRRIAEVREQLEAAEKELHPADANFTLICRHAAHRLLPGRRSTMRRNGS